MGILIWIGSGLTLLGLAGILYCGVSAARARAAGLEDAQLRKRLQRLVAVNLGSLAVSGMGLICVITGLFLA